MQTFLAEVETTSSVPTYLGPTIKQRAKESTPSHELVIAGFVSALEANDFDSNFDSDVDSNFDSNPDSNFDSNSDRNSDSNLDSSLLL